MRFTHPTLRNWNGFEVGALGVIKLRGLGPTVDGRND